MSGIWRWISGRTLSTRRLWTTRYLKERNSYFSRIIYPLPPSLSHRCSWEKINLFNHFMKNHFPCLEHRLFPRSFKLGIFARICTGFFAELEEWMIFRGKLITKLFFYNFPPSYTPPLYILGFNFCGCFLLIFFPKTLIYLNWPN